MGLQLSGSVQLEGNLLVTGSTNSVFQNVLVSGRLTAQEINTQLVSSSIIYSSGSNKFGDESGDKHQFTGSVDVSGSLNIDNTDLTITKTAIGSGTVVGNINFRNMYMGDFVWAQIQGVNGGTHDFSNISFSTTYGFNTLTEKVRITDIGNLNVLSGSVGIGTVTPADVIDAGLGMAIVSSTGRTGLTLGSAQTETNEVLGRLSFTNTNSTNIGSKRLAYVSGVRGATNNSAYLEFGTANDALGSTKMILDVSGSLSLNTTRVSGNNANILTLADNVTGLQTSEFGVRILATSNNGQAKSAIGFEADGGTNNDTRISFYTQLNASSLDRQVTITRNGNLNLVTGNLVIGTAGKGIDFSTATPDGTGTVTSELLDDYEEGTFTPTTAGDATGALGDKTGEYTKIGNVVNFRMACEITNNFTSFAIGGLPFTIGGSGSPSSVQGGMIVLNASAANIIGRMDTGVTSISFFSDNNVSSTLAPTTAMGILRMSGTYRV